MNYNSIIARDLIAEVNNQPLFAELIVDWGELSNEEKFKIYDELFLYSPVDVRDCPEMFMCLSLVIPKDNGVPDMDKVFVHAKDFVCNMDDTSVTRFLNYIYKGVSTGSVGEDEYYKLTNKFITLSAAEKIQILNKLTPTIHI